MKPAIDSYTVEVAVPVKVMRYNDGSVAVSVSANVVAEIHPIHAVDTKQIVAYRLGHNNVYQDVDEAIKHALYTIKNNVQREAVNVAYPPETE